MLTFFRVDDRLIHGQIVESWIPAMGINAVLEISDEVSGDPLRQNLLKFAVPEGILLRISSLDSAADALRQMQDTDLLTLVLMPSLSEAEAIIEKGIKIPLLNLGGIIYTAFRNLSAGNAIFISDAEKGILKSIADHGVRLDCRGVPSDVPVDVSGVVFANAGKGGN